MKLDSSLFAQMALDLLKNANIPGVALDAAMEFRAVAREMAEGRLVISDATAPQDQA